MKSPKTAVMQKESFLSSPVAGFPLGMITKRMPPLAPTPTTMTNEQYVQSLQNKIKELEEQLLKKQNDSQLKIVNQMLTKKVDYLE